MLEHATQQVIEGFIERQMSLADAEQPAPDLYFRASTAHAFIIGCALFSILWGAINVLLIRGVDLDDHQHVERVMQQERSNQLNLTEKESEERASEVMGQMKFIGEKITEGAISFLRQEYLYLCVYSLLFALVLCFTVDMQEMHAATPTNFPYTATAYLVGSATSILSGYVGMRIAVYTNTRTTFQCCKDINEGFFTAFRGGQVLGFTLVGLALLVLELLIVLFKVCWLDDQLQGLGVSTAEQVQASELIRRLFELVAGYGLGGSSVALFGRVGGGIYTKAADVGADLVGKTLKDLKEDDPSNPGTIADNVGDNVGDIAGMGADLFGSLAESTCAALVVSSTSVELILKENALYFPLMITSCGIVASFLSVLLAHLFRVTEQNVQQVLKAQIGISTVLMTLALVPIVSELPEEFSFRLADGTVSAPVSNWTAYSCVVLGLWSGMVIGFTTEYYTSASYSPTLYLAESCKNGPAPNIIQGLALGYISCIVPIFCLTATIGYAFSQVGMYGIGLSALGMLGSLPVALTIDGYGPISDNSGGIAEMSGLPSQIRDRTDALDAAGNTTAAVGKGFAIGSAALVGLALFGAFITRVEETGVQILDPVTFSGLLVGAMLPYAFSAMTMKAVGDAAFEMMNFIIQDFEKGEEAKRSGGEYSPDYDGCIKISTDASLKKMVAPGAIVIGAPLLSGFVFGPKAVAGLLAGSIISGVQMAISASNTGGAWDNAKKHVEKQRSQFRAEVQEQNIDLDSMKERLAELDEETAESAETKDLRKWTSRQQQLREMHVAAVVGDTVGDPLKDTSGPAINILIKLSAITSLVFGKYMQEHYLLKGSE